ncbi:hypothetical protein THAOC_15725 [Thalassiosira oceanica]|uniref:Uncharacterized protein n=1 Tax=Thalassiosira oceanica TaxID=159749 RepID=K0SRG5_THAOC|nr:hypothetical protein THAOC_15725 [Thalassiosira oceanica]|eukprot:EJK63606.1 hypothetical protein THAOC_15725 [Thalassiosira oceanica]
MNRRRQNDAAAMDATLHDADSMDATLRRSSNRHGFLPCLDAPLRIFRYDDDRQKWREVRHYNEISRHDPFATLTTLLTTQRTDRRGSYPKARHYILNRDSECLQLHSLYR